ncbi:MAG: oxygen-independent coproporphyrinogen III oxidase [Ignavibacteriales bacterium]|nr:oxygen-independent coproporphyrinogen III oxidase [Ignavibacteriales bacterium]
MRNVFANVDLELLERFDKPGPRYTSYPTAPVFSAEYNDKKFEVDLIRNNDENDSPISLYIHIPFCDTLCYFCGCTTVITRNRDHIKGYLAALRLEIAKVSAYVGKRRLVTQMHWGGGTPSYLDPSEIRDLFQFIRAKFQFSSDAEISVEIDPRELTLEHIKAFREGGVNRICLGVQDFNERVQTAVHRVQPEHITLDAIKWAKSVGVEGINIDLIYGLPLQTLDSFQKTLEKVVELSPGRIAVFNFAYVPWMKPHQKLIHPEDLPSPDLKLRLLKTTIETLTNLGYLYIGMDHFAKPNDELALAQREKALHRNFQGYSTKAGADLYGFGMSAISHFGDVYAQNVKSLEAYVEATTAGKFPTAIGYKMSKDDQLRKFVIMRLMCDLEVEKGEVEELFDIMFDEYFDQSLDQLFDFVRLGLVKNTVEKITVEPAGRLMLRNIAMCFDAYLNKFQKEKPIFSRTV